MPKKNKTILHVCFCIMLAAVLFLNTGCGKKKDSEADKLKVKTPNKVSDETVKEIISVDDLAAEKAEARKMLESLPPIERAEMQKYLDSLDKVSDDVESTKLPKFFEPNQEVKDIINNALKALRMDLPEAEKLAAIEQLEGIDNPIVLEVVNQALDEPNEDIREAALDAIMDISDPVVLPMVMKALDDESPDIREYALDALMDINDESINEALMKALDDENAEVRDNAIDTMLYIEEPAIIPSLGKAMSDPDPDIREKAIITIEDIPDPRAVDILIDKGLLNENEEIREDALDSIEFITDQEFKDYQEARDWWDKNRDTFEFDD